MLFMANLLPNGLEKGNEMFYVIFKSRLDVQFVKKILLEKLNRLEVVVQSCSVKKVFLEISGKHLYQRFFFNKVPGLACNFIKKESLALVLSVNFRKFLRTSFLQSTSGGCL